MKIKGDLVIDVSWYERVVDWKVANPRPSMIIPRATYGERIDTEFENHWKQCMDLNIRRGAFHYLFATPLLRGQTPQQSIGDQAENFVTQVRKNGFTPQDTIWMDWETQGNEKAPGGLKLQALIKQWLDHVERELGIRPGIYSRKDQLERMMFLTRMPAWINDYDHWLAWYPYDNVLDGIPDFPRNSPRITPMWLNYNKIALWQYTEKGLLPGVKVLGDDNKTLLETTYDFNYIYPWYQIKIGLDGNPVSVITEDDRFEIWWKTNGYPIEAIPTKGVAKRAWFASLAEKRS